MLKKVNVSLYSKSDKSKLNILINALIVIIAVIVICEIAFSATYSGIYVVGTSMNDTLIGATVETEPGGDYVYVNRHAKPTYGDVVVVFKDDRFTIIKRVVAFGGDSVKLIDGVLYIRYAGSEEFQLVEESYVSPEHNTGKGPQKISFPIENGFVKEEGFCVKEGHMFLLGDNRDVSLDSRESGGRSYSLNDLYGVVTKWSLKHKSFFTSLHKYFDYDLPRYFGIKK